MADNNKVVFGLSNVHYAVATIASNGTATYQTPVAIPGAVNLSLDPQGDTTKFNADNIVYYVSSSNTGYEGELEIAKVPDSFKKDVLGYVEDSNGILLEDVDAITKNFALLFELQGDANATRHVMYNCKATRNAVNASTTTETKEPQTQTIPINASSVYNSGIQKNISKGKCDATQTTQYSSWMTAVYQSTTLASV